MLYETNLVFAYIGALIIIAFGISEIIKIYMQEDKLEKNIIKNKELDSGVIGGIAGAIASC